MKSRSVSVRLVPQLTGSRFITRQFACALLIAGSLSAIPALGSPGGELDPAFGEHGRILLRESRFEELGGVNVFVDPGSGRLMAVATGYYDNALLRFTSDGSLDNDFGNQGAVPLDFGDDSLDILDAEQLADGRLLIAGAMDVFGDPAGVIHGSGLLARMHTDGSPDLSFGSSGRAMFQLGGVYESLSEIMIQADGRIVVLGSTNRTGGVERILARYTADGLPDASFGNSATPGIGVIDLAGIDANLATIVQQSSGTFMACGNATSKTASPSTSEVLAVRIRPDGVRDSAFGSNGMVSIGGSQESVEIADCLELADGHLIFVGSSGSGELRRAASLRLTPDGRLDAAFGDNGMVVLDTDLPSAATTMLVMSDGALAIAGQQWKPVDGWVSWADMLVARIDPTSGAIDRGFGDRGVTTIDFGTRWYPGVAVPASLMQQPDGKLVIIGSQIDRYDWYYAFNIAITRIDPNGSGSNGWAGLTATHSTVPRADDTIALHLRRTGGSTGRLSVDYRTVDGTASAGLHYVASNGTVTWSDGDLSEKMLLIAVLNAEPVTDFRDFNVELFNSSGGLAVDQANISLSLSESSSGSPPPATPQPAGSSGTYGGGGAIGIELWFLIALAVFGGMHRIGRSVPAKMAVSSLLLAAGCGGGGSGGGGGGGDGGPSSPPAGGTGSVRVKVTDYFGQPVAGAQVSWLGNSTLETISDEEGNASLDNVPSGVAGVCAHHDVRGYACGPDDLVTIPVDSTLDVSRQLLPGWSPPIAAVLETRVEPDGLSPDGQTLDVTIRVAVTKSSGIGSWFDVGSAYPLAVADCVARGGQELIDLGPRCVRGPGGTDSSYAFDGLIEHSYTKTISQPALPATVGLLFDASAAVWNYEENAVESRLFAAKIFADKVLPDTGLLLAGFAGNDPAGINLARLPQTPVTFLPVHDPGPFVSKPEVFEQLDELMSLSGGVAPLYPAILSSIDFVADGSIPGTRRILVVMANGRDDVCGTPAQCTAMRGQIAARATDKQVELILLGSDGIDPVTSRTEEAISMLSVDTSAPLVVGSGTFHEALDLVRQLLGETALIEDVRVRLKSEGPGAFRAGVIVAGELVGFSPSNCPWDCYAYVLPFSVHLQ